MSFSVPNFNLTCNVWSGSSPPPAPPRVSAVPCNLAYGRRVNVAALPTAFYSPIMTLLLPVGTDIRSAQSGANDYVEVPAGSGRYYDVFGVDDVGKGFSNEHRFAIITPTAAFGNWPTPYP